MSKYVTRPSDGNSGEKATTQRETAKAESSKPTTRRRGGSNSTPPQLNIVVPSPRTQRPGCQPSQAPATLSTSVADPGYKPLKDKTPDNRNPSQRRYMRKKMPQNGTSSCWTDVTGNKYKDEKVQNLIDEIEGHECKVWLSRSGATGLQYEAVVKKGKSVPKEQLKSPSKFGMSDDDDEIIASEYGRTPEEAILNCGDDMASSSHSTIAIEEETLDCGDGAKAPIGPVRRLSDWLGVPQ